MCDSAQMVEITSSRRQYDKASSSTIALTVVGTVIWEFRMRMTEITPATEERGSAI